MKSSDLVAKASALVEAIYANLEDGKFKCTNDDKSTKGAFIVGTNIREELVELEEELPRLVLHEYMQTSTFAEEDYPHIVDTWFGIEYPLSKYGLSCHILLEEDGMYELSIYPNKRCGKKYITTEYDKPITVFYLTEEELQSYVTN